MHSFKLILKGAELLYTVIKECVLSPGLTAPPNESILLDVCCGTGTIGLCLSDVVKQVVLLLSYICKLHFEFNLFCLLFVKVIGIELCESAVLDAKFNSVLNNVSNATFYASRAEHILGDILKSVTSSTSTNITTYNNISPNTPCIAVVDPPRAGLHPDVIRLVMIQ